MLAVTYTWFNLTEKIHQHLNLENFTLINNSCIKDIINESNQKSEIHNAITIALISAKYQNLQAAAKVGLRGGKKKETGFM